MKGLLGGFGIAGVLVAAVALWGSAPAEAATGFNIVTSPLPMKLVTEPGKTVTQELRLKNMGDQPETINVGLMKFGATGESGQPNLFDLTPKDTYAKWVSFSPQQFTAEPNVWQTVKMTIKVPNDAALGYYLAVTYSRASQQTEKEATNYRGAAANLVLLNVRVPNEKRDLNLVSFSADQKLYEYLPATFNVKVRNSGNIYVAPTGNIFIEKSGKTIATLNFNEAGGSVLPDSNRVYKETWKAGFPLFTDRLVNGKPEYDENNKPKADLKWDFSEADNFRFGRYTAKLLLVYDDGKQDVPLESTVSFWVMPWKVMFVGLLSLAILAYGLFSMFRNGLARARVTTGKSKGHDRR